MTTYNTGNPIGSKDPRDLYDNAENLDTAVNDTSSDTWNDRLGRSRKTMSGMERQFDTAEDYREATFDLTQADKQNRFNDFIASSGYQFLGDYAADIEITEYNQIIRDSNGEFWRLSGQVELPYTTTGAGLPENDALTPLGDAVLRQELATPGKGAAMVAGGVVMNVDTIADLQALPTSDLVNGQQVQVKEYHAGTGVGGGEFYWDALSTATENGGTVFGNEANGRWLRIVRDGLLATYFGAIPDADKSTYTGTDNSDVQLAIDEYAYQAGYHAVYWPEGAYRFTQPFQRKVPHFGRHFNEFNSPSVTFILDNPSPTTWLTGKGVGPFEVRSHDIRNIDFISAQDKIHTLFDGHGYKLLIENCAFRRFDVVFDIDGVYVWWKNCYFQTINTGIYPRALIGTGSSSGLRSTMFSLDHCVFYGYKIGFHHENRGFGITDNHNELMSLIFTNCGFENGLDSGIKIEHKVWYLNTTNCWSEFNGVAGVNIADNGSAKGTDWFDAASRWDDAVIDQTEYGVLRASPVRFTFGRVEHPLWTHKVNGTLSSNIYVKNTGEIEYSDFPATASVNDGVFQVDFPKFIERPVISVTPYWRHNSLSYSIRLDHPVDPGSVELYTVLSRIKIMFFDPTDPSTLITPDWCAISLSWPSGANPNNPSD